ncbi:acetate--CoA ligase [Nannocystis bainbridge]|uniref:Acetyl-coenzyme A synthetase n=1 Tax=Nannocystis bainbridge TaxID=2995303 RepID=A0ABT5E2W4_9BACT|nr:acetate--CoA ligase [Nannocystis bainbridge]MDC0720207.1 acetate--CoA ligase [Nannocystis bainbridge]
MSETSLVPPSPSFAAGALVSSRAAYDELYRRSVDDPAGFWGEQAARIAWHRPYDAVCEADPRPGEIAWFTGGQLNVSYNCVDRHAAVTPDRPAILWARNEPGEYETITFRDLQERVGRFANVLRAHGVKKGDRVCIYLPMIPEIACAMLACARIGAVHSVVFAGFSAEALRERILDAECAVVITADEGLRGPKRVPLKPVVDAAVAGLDSVRTVLVARRTGAEVAMTPGRDLWLADELARQRATCPIEWVDSEDPLFVLYTSGSTGKPKGVLHTTGGYLVYAATTHRYVFDAREGDIHFCAADAGWITGHSYIVYGPLANGVTTVMFESIPTYPDAGRYWQVVDDLRATIVYTAPTALRALLREGDEPVRKYRRDSVRVLGTVGEPINPDVWRWYFEVVGDGRCPVVDTWWQTETGGVLIAPLPGAIACKPGSATLPFFGVRPLLLDDDGNLLEGNDVAGNLCLAGSWPGQARTIYGDHARFLANYFARFPGYYFTGDGCRRDGDGYYWITGRVDDVLNVAGHRLGTAEIESALVGHPAVVEAAVVGFPHDLKGQGICAYVITRPEFDGADPDKLIAGLKEQVRKVISPIATPDRILQVRGLPKTRSGKIMRRILRKIAGGEFDPGGFGDISTLAEPAVVDEIVGLARKA